LVTREAHNLQTVNACAGSSPGSVIKKLMISIDTINIVVIAGNRLLHLIAPPNTLSQNQEEEIILH
jgi:hypothetical protein